jgi:signal transduction histidine kinase
MVIAKVLETGGAARIDREPGSRAPHAWMVPQREMRASVGVPIFVQGALWGVIGAEFDREQIAGGAERRMAEFTELAATAIANAEGRAELAASRARIVTASDETRRRIERDLHDGTQQRLVSISLDVRSAEATLPADLDEPRRALGRVVDGLDGAINELREISRGIHPAILSQGGVGPALRTLARRSALPVELRVAAEARWAEPIEVASYYVVSEALTNATKHARASRVEVDVAERGGRLRLSIRDDGVGGADLRRGSGLIGLRDRVEALGGSIEVISPAGEGTHIVVELPLELD